LQPVKSGATVAEAIKLELENLGKSDFRGVSTKKLVEIADRVGLKKEKLRDRGYGDVKGVDPKLIKEALKRGAVPPASLQ
jgi:hypothetical protein